MAHPVTPKASKMMAATFKTLPLDFAFLPSHFHLSLDVNYPVSCPFLHYTLHNTPHATTLTHTHTHFKCQTKRKKRKRKQHMEEEVEGQSTFTLCLSATNLRGVHGAALHRCLLFLLLQLGANQRSKVKGYSFLTFS